LGLVPVVDEHVSEPDDIPPHDGDVDIASFPSSEFEGEDAEEGSEVGEDQEDAAADEEVAPWFNAGNNQQQQQQLGGGADGDDIDEV
jgi:hypothetical protein